MATLCPVLKQQFFDDDGVPLASGRIYTYEAGTLVAKDTYTDATGNTENTNPIILDAGGFADIWLDGSYKIRVYAYIDDVEVFQYETDNVTELSSSTNNFSSPYFVWSDVDSESLNGETQGTVTGIDSSAKELVVSLRSISLSGNNGLALRVGTSSGILSTAVYVGESRETSVTGGTLNQLQWGGTLDALTANTYAGLFTSMTSSSNSIDADLIIRKYDTNKYHIYGWCFEYNSSNDGIKSYYINGRVDTPAAIDRIQILTGNTDTFDNAGATMYISQYANTGNIEGSNQGPFSNQYSSTGTNTYALTIRGDQVAPTEWFDGMEFEFRPENTNSSTSVTINPHAIGAKTVVLSDGTTVPPIGFLRSDMSFRGNYDLSLDKAIITHPVKLVDIAYGGTGQRTAALAYDAFTVAASDIASATTTNIAASSGYKVNITGTTTIEAFGTAAAGIVRFVRFTGALTLTYNATSLILPGGSSYTTRAGDTAIFVSEGSGNWRCWNYTINAASPIANMIQYFHAQDKKSSGSSGGGFTSGSWQTRTLNTVVANTITNASLSSNQITLPAGTYEVHASAPAFGVDEHRAKIGIPGGSDLIMGQNAIADGVTGSVSIVSGPLVLASETILTLQHKCSDDNLSNGFGTACTFGDDEVYANILIRRIV